MLSLHENPLPGCYIITGGAIKLTRTMQEREHTLKELSKMVFMV